MTYFVECENCKVSFDDEFSIKIYGPHRKETFCPMCFEAKYRVHPSVYLGGKYNPGAIIEVKEAMRLGPKAQNQIYITDTHDDRITKLETNVANHEQKIGKLEEDMKRESSPDSNILYNANAKRIRKLEIALKQSILAIENEL